MPFVWFTSCMDVAGSRPLAAKSHRTCTQVQESTAGAPGLASNGAGPQAGLWAVTRPWCRRGPGSGAGAAPGHQKPGGFHSCHSDPAALQDSASKEEEGSPLSPGLEVGGAPGHGAARELRFTPFKFYLELSWNVGVALYTAVIPQQGSVCSRSTRQ